MNTRYIIKTSFLAVALIAMYTAIFVIEAGRRTL